VDEIPQVIEPAAEQATAGEDQRSYVRDDGVLVINILVDPPCGPSTEGEIVVCAPPESDGQPAPAPAPPEQGFRPEIQLGDNAKIRARGESDPWSGADRAMIDLVIKF